MYRLNYYCKKSFLNNNTQIKSIQAITIPKTVTRTQTTNLISPPFLSQVDHLTTISVNQLTTGIKSKRICTKRLCLLNQVMLCTSKNICIIILPYKNKFCPFLRASVNSLFTFRALRPALFFALDQQWLLFR